MAGSDQVRLGEILVQQKLLSEEQLEFCLEEQKRTGHRLGMTLVENGFATEEQISGAIAKQLNLPYINLKFYHPNLDIVGLLPETQARRFGAIALEERGDALLIGLADPTDVFASEEIARLTKRRIELAAVSQCELWPTIDRLYRSIEENASFTHEPEHALDDSYDLGPLGGVPGIEEAPIVKLLRSLFDTAMQERASDIHIDPQEGHLQIRFRIDGVLHTQTEVDIALAQALALRVKLMSGLDISESRLPQEGRFPLKIGQHQIDVRTSTMLTRYGESIVMRLLNRNDDTLKLDSFGMPPSMLKRFRALLRCQSGLLLVAGPAFSGKSATLYGALAELSSKERKLLTVDNPVGYRLPGVVQAQVNEKIELSFAKVLKVALRQDPDVVLLGEIGNQEAAQISMQAALAGRLVLSSLNANDAAGAVFRLQDLGVPRHTVATSLLAVLAQRLVRLICESCAEPYTLKPAEQEWLKAEVGETVEYHIYLHGRGCEHCNGTGYRGRTGVYEMLEMTEALAYAASHYDPAHFKKAAHAQMAGHTLRSQAAALAVAGKTTVSEAMRSDNHWGG